MPAGTDPFGGGGDEEADEALEPVLDVKTLDCRADGLKDVQVKVLEHGRNQQENSVFLEIREREMGPSEVVVLAVEVAL